MPDHAPPPPPPDDLLDIFRPQILPRTGPSLLRRVVSRLRRLARALRRPR
jgi:hypothetical protein